MDLMEQMEDNKDQTEQKTTSTNNEKKSEPNSGSWWDSWVTSAKSKSAEVYSMVKKDLDEIGTAVKSEASHVYNTTSTVLGKTLKLDEPESPANVMKKSFSTFMGQVSTVLNPEPDDEDTEAILVTSGDTIALATYQRELEALQRVDATFLVPVSGPEFEAWRSTLETDESGAVLGERAARRKLEAAPVLKEQYERLVPEAVEAGVFWERYLFRVALLHDRLAAAARSKATPAAGEPVTRPPPRVFTDPVMAHLPVQELELNEPQLSESSSVPSVPSKESQESTPDVDPTALWDDADFASDVELTEEQQMQLLAEYEKEITTKKQNKTKDNVNNNNVSMDNARKATKNASSNIKSDICGNNLVEDHFVDKAEIGKRKGKRSNGVRDDAGSNSSDESWEKEFEIEDEIENLSKRMEYQSVA